MKVVIDKTGSSDFWYSTLIGEILDVELDTDGYIIHCKSAQFESLAHRNLFSKHTYSLGINFGDATEVTKNVMSKMILDDECNIMNLI